MAASELYNTRLEAHLTRRVGVRFADAARGRGKRPVREIVGMSTELDVALVDRAARRSKRAPAELAKQFQADHGREPTNVEMHRARPASHAGIARSQTRTALAGRAAPHLAHTSR